MREEKPVQMLWGHAVRLAEGSLLSMLGQKSIDALGMRWRKKSYPADAVMVNAEDPAQDVWFLLEGKAKATVYTESGREVAFVSLTPGDCFGEFSAIDEAPRSSSVVAVTNCVAARVSSATFRDLMHEHPEFAFAVCRVLVWKLRRMTDRITEITALSAAQRTARHILTLARKHRIGTTDEALIATPPTAIELAGFLSTNRETVQREIDRLRKQKGLLLRERPGLALRVPSIAALEAAIAMDALPSDPAADA